MKLSWYIIEVACSDFYRPDLDRSNDSHSEFLCVAGNLYSHRQYNYILMQLNHEMRNVIQKNMGGWMALVNYLKMEHNIPRTNLTARYDWFLNLAVSLENAGQ